MRIQFSQRLVRRLSSVVVLAIPLLVLLSACGSPASSANSTSSSDAKFVTALGCDIRNSGLQVCTERKAVERACPVGMNRAQAEPSVRQGAAGSGSFSIWHNGQSAIAEVQYVPSGGFVTISSYTSSCTAELTSEEWDQLSVPGTALPRALR